MSETIFKFHPLHPRDKFDSDDVAAIEALILEYNESSIDPSSIRLETFNNVHFIDCGTRLERIRCPRCSTEIDRDVWQSAMDADYTDENGFALSEWIDCSCGFASQLHGLVYQAPCAFASACLSVRVHSHFWAGWLGHFPWVGQIEARY